MKRYIWIVGLPIVLLAGFIIGSGSAQAQGIPPAYSTTPNVNPTMYILDANDSDITDTWLPSPGEKIFITFQGITPVSVEFGTVPYTSVSTSSYPGECTNCGDPTDTSLDFESPVEAFKKYELFSKDTGGRFVILVTDVDGNTFYFVGPRDDDLDGIPTYWESNNCPGGNCEPDQDIDTGPEAESSYEDGFANIDEFRGWRVAGGYVRGDPEVKDVFFHIEETQCTDGTMGDWVVDPKTVNLEYFFGPDLEELFANVNTLSPLMNIHRINSDEWVDHFDHYDGDRDIVVLSGDSPDNATWDRCVNQNAIVPLGNPESNLGHNFVKGVRAIECLDLGSISPIGLADKNPPNLLIDNNGYGVVFVHRVVNFVLNEIKFGSPRGVKYKTFENGKWVDKETLSDTSSNNPQISDPEVESIIKIVLAWVFAHEIWNHAVDVRATAQSTRKASYGYHNAPGDGTVVDLKVEVIRDRKDDGYTNFYVPLYYGTVDKQEIRVLESQEAPL